MRRETGKGPDRLLKILPLAVLLASASYATMAGPSADPLAARVTALESHAGNLTELINGANSALGRDLVPPMEVERFDIAQNRDTAQLLVRLDQVEEQMRILTGQVEGLQFQMTQLQTFLERMQSDYEDRFTVLEGGSLLGKTDAAPQSGGAMPSGEVPQSTDTNTVQPPSVVNDDPVTPGVGTPPQTLGTLPADALPSGPLPAGQEPLPDYSQTLDLDLGLGDPFSNGAQPLDLDQDRGSIVTDADAEAQYNAGFDALQRGDYQFAEAQFRQFTDLFRNHRLTPDAIHWLGETLLQRGANEEAAEVLLDGFNRFPNVSRSPDLLLKLGISLSRQGQRETACRTYVELLRRFPDLPESFKARVGAEQRESQC